jgi:RNA polymerase sigma-70 factor (ECF subfamily)
MPPAPFEYHGTAAAHGFFTAVDAHRRGTDRMVPVRANGQPAWGEYRRDPVTGVLHLAGIDVVGLAGGRIREITRFENAVAPYFGLPRTLG